MSQANVEVVRRVWEGWETDDLVRGLAVIDDAVVTRTVAPLPDRGTWSGPEGLLDLS